MPTNNEQLDNQPKTPDIEGSVADTKQITTDEFHHAAKKSVDAAQNLFKAMSETIKTADNKLKIRALIPLDQSGMRFTIGQYFDTQDSSKVLPGLNQLYARDSFQGESLPYSISNSSGSHFDTLDSSRATSFLALTQRLFGSTDLSAGTIAHIEPTPTMDVGMALSNNYGGARVSLRNGVPTLDEISVKGNLLGTDIALGGSHNPQWKDTLGLKISKKLDTPTVIGGNATLSLQASTERNKDIADDKITVNLEGKF